MIDFHSWICYTVITARGTTEKPINQIKEEKEMFIIRYWNVLKDIDTVTVARKTKKAAENVCMKALKKYGAGTVAIIENEHGEEIETYC